MSYKFKHKGKIAVRREIRSLDREFLALQAKREGRGQDEIAKILGVGPRNVSNVLRRILDRYRNEAKQDAERYIIEEDLVLLDLRHRLYNSLLVLDKEEAATVERLKWLEARKTRQKKLGKKMVTVVSQTVMEGIEGLLGEITQMRKVRGDIMGELRKQSESRRRLWGMDRTKFVPLDDEGNPLATALTSVLVSVAQELGRRPPKIVDGKIIEALPAPNDRDDRAKK